MSQLKLWGGKPAVCGRWLQSPRSFAVADILVWMVCRSTNRGDLLTFGRFVVAVVAPVASLVVYLTKLRRPGGTGLGRPPGELADCLAAARK